MDVGCLRLGQLVRCGRFLVCVELANNRLWLPNARVLIHQPSGGASGQATDVRLMAEEIIRMRTLTSTIIAHHTGQKFDQVELDVERDRILTPIQAKEYGLIDEVIEHREK